MKSPEGLDYPYNWPEPWRLLSVVVAGLVIGISFCYVRDSIRLRQDVAMQQDSGPVVPCYVQRPATGSCK
jgi:hypothetical protein